MSVSDQNRKGYVYFFSDDDEFVKIGFAQYPNDRLVNLNTGRPHKCGFLTMIKTTAESEKIFHDHFIHIKHEREWFHNTQEISECVDDIFDFQELKQLLDDHKNNVVTLPKEKLYKMRQMYFTPEDVTYMLNREKGQWDLQGIITGNYAVNSGNNS